MKTKYTVSKTGYMLSNDNIEEVLEESGVGKLSLAEYLNDQIFFGNKKSAKEIGDAEGGSPIKRKVAITVVITDVVEMEKKKK